MNPNVFLSKMVIFQCRISIQVCIFFFQCLCKKERFFWNENSTVVVFQYLAIFIPCENPQVGCWLGRGKHRCEMSDLELGKRPLQIWGFTQVSSHEDKKPLGHILPLNMNFASSLAQPNLFPTFFSWAVPPKWVLWSVPFGVGRPSRW